MLKPICYNFIIVTIIVDWSYKRGNLITRVRKKNKIKYKYILQEKYFKRSKSQHLNE